MQGFMFIRQVLYHLHHISSPFCHDYFEGRVWLLAQAGLNYDLILSFLPWLG
jgi:hypothetical protein